MAGPDAPAVALEALIFCGASPAALRRALNWTPGQIAAAVKEINAQLEKSGRPYEIVETAGGYRFRTRPEFGELLASAQPERKLRLSRAALDTLAVVAYRQPVSRPELEELRSVDCGAVLKSLLDRGLVRIVGRRDAPGRPALYGTSAAFLETFGLKSLRDLPDLGDLLPAPAEAEGTPLEEALGDSARTDAEPSEVRSHADGEPLDETPAGQGSPLQDLADDPDPQLEPSSPEHDSEDGGEWEPAAADADESSTQLEGSPDQASSEGRQGSRTGAGTE